MSRPGNLKQMMKAKHVKLEHPYARYSARGALSCSLCPGLPLKEVQWSAHLISKGHRAKVREKEADEQGREAKRRRVETPPDEPEETQSTSALPADFFADASQAPVPLAAADTEMPDGAPTDGDRVQEDDDEMNDFLSSLAAEPSGPAPAPSTASATVIGAPVLYEHGAPVVLEEGEEAPGQDDDEEEVGETEDEKRAREEKEEREEIMERIEEEEREQREADEKVVALKKKLEAIRAARKAKSEGKAKA